jgi:hypothetical protein
MSEGLSGNAFSLAAKKRNTHYLLIADRGWGANAKTVDAFVRACVERGYNEKWLRVGEGAPQGHRLAQAQPLPTLVLDTLATARQAVDRIVKSGIPRGDAWSLIEDVAQAVASEVEPPAPADYVAAAMAHPRAQALLAANRTRRPTPLPPVTEHFEPGLEKRLLVGAGGNVGLEVPGEGDPQRPPNVRRRAVPKGNKR